MPQSLVQRLQTIPKIDLHHHLDGAVRTQTVLDLARKHQVTLPTYELDELERHVTVQPDCRSLSDFLDCFQILYPVLQYPSSMERIAFELCEDFADQNVIYAETRFAPVLLTEEDAAQEDMVKAVIRGLHRGQDTYDTEINVILCLYRGRSREENRKTLKLAYKYEDEGVIGVDLAGDESQFGSVEHPELLEQAAGSGLNLTIHAGEAGPVENIRRAIALGADRIGHGVRAIDDAELRNELAEKQVPLELCFTSNLQTQAVVEASEHPLPKFYDEGLRVTVNTDDPRISRTSIAEEFRKIVHEFELRSADCLKLLCNAAESAFCSDEKRRTLKQTIKSSYDEDG
jgi:adenosine deaminase